MVCLYHADNSDCYTMLYLGGEYEQTADKL